MKFLCIIPMLLSAGIAALPSAFDVEQAIIPRDDHNVFNTRALVIRPRAFIPDSKSNRNFRSDHGLRRRGLCFGKQCSKTSDPSIPPTNSDLSQPLLAPDSNSEPTTSTRPQSSSPKPMKGQILAEQPRPLRLSAVDPEAAPKQENTRKTQEQLRSSPGRITNDEKLPTTSRRAPAYRSYGPPSTMLAGIAPLARAIQAGGYGLPQASSHRANNLMRRGSCLGKTCKNGPSTQRNSPRLATSSQNVQVGSSPAGSLTRQSTQATTPDRSGASQRSLSHLEAASTEKRRTGDGRPGSASTIASGGRSDRSPSGTSALPSPRSPGEGSEIARLPSVGGSSGGSMQIQAVHGANTQSPPQPLTPATPMTPMIPVTPTARTATHRYNDSINMLYGDQQLPRQDSIDKLYRGRSSK